MKSLTGMIMLFLPIFLYANETDIDDTSSGKLPSASFEPGYYSVSSLSPSASFIGVDKNARIGYYLSSAGDVNGDGLDDFMVGLYHSYRYGWNSGGVYLFLGRKELPWGMGESINEADAYFCGKTAYDLVGYNIAGQGDFNGDGYDDLLIGAPGNWESYPKVTGTLFIVLGKPDVDYGKDFVLKDRADLSFIGEVEDDQLGYAVDFIGDVNHDGCDDVLCAAPFKNIGGNKWTGKVYLILGRRSGFQRDILAKDDAAATFVFPQYEGIFGTSLTGVGDMNGDGTPDFAISVYGIGSVVLMWGRAECDWGQDFDCHNANYIFTREDTPWDAGWQTKRVGDVNSDGIPDFAVTGPDLESGRGKTYVIFGRQSWQSKQINLYYSDASFIGEGVPYISGYSLNVLGDFNGDDIDDFVIGSCAYTSLQVYSCGKIYLINGKADGWQNNTSLTDVADSYETDIYRCCFGWGTAGVGDFNGDTRPDFIVSAPFYSDCEDWRYGDLSWVGQIFLFLGNYPLADLNGQTTYFGNHLPVPAVQLDLRVGMDQSIQSGDDGTFHFYMKLDKDYQVVPSKPARTDMNEICITAYDAALTARHAMKFDSLNPAQQLAADVNRDSAITLYDAALILRYALDFPDRPGSFPGNWSFIPEMRYINDVIEDNYAADFTCFVVGDVDTSWQLPGAALHKSEPAHGFEIPHPAIAAEAAFIELPVHLIENRNIMSFQIAVEFDSNHVEFYGFEKSGAIADFSTEANQKSGILKIGGFGIQPAAIEDRLLTLKFRRLRGASSDVAFHWQQFLIDNYEFQTGTTIIEIDHPEAANLPGTYTLFQNYPNPFNPGTLIRFYLDQPVRTHLSIYNVVGQEIRLLADENKSPGYHELSWDGTDSEGRSVSDGVYFLKANFNNACQIKKMLKIK
ncbi:FG-GAP repeat protein [candidate division KSB1 bacterium]|nr:FG-GAP repeat protein [candidate division KSB1 bacterium]